MRLTGGLIMGGLMVPLDPVVPLGNLLALGMPVSFGDITFGANGKFNTSTLAAFSFTLPFFLCLTLKGSVELSIICIMKIEMIKKLVEQSQSVSYNHL